MLSGGGVVGDRRSFPVNCAKSPDRRLIRTRVRPRRVIRDDDIVRRQIAEQR